MGLDGPIPGSAPGKCIMDFLLGDHICGERCYYHLLTLFGNTLYNCDMRI